MGKKIEDYLPLYLGCDVQFVYETRSNYPHLKEQLRVGRLVGIFKNGVVVEAQIVTPNGAIYRIPGSEVKPILRKLDSMTEDEMIGLLMAMVPEDMEDKPTAEDYDVEMFYNDNATMVDGDVAVGANWTCICHQAQIGITYDGTIAEFDEDGKRSKQYNIPQAYRYLLSRHFDLFNLIPEGLALNAATI